MSKDDGFDQHREFMAAHGEAVRLYIRGMAVPRTHPIVLTDHHPQSRRFWASVSQHTPVENAEANFTAVDPRCFDGHKLATLIGSESDAWTTFVVVQGSLLAMYLRDHELH